tara:strand:+ start:448 stop:1509 length:1062 start_codon:yes stop_codon:yes gene_type:complete
MIELGTVLDDCLLVYSDGELLSEVDEKVKDAVEEYRSNILLGDYYKCKNIWLDTKDGTLFSDAQFVMPRNAGKDQNFFCPPGRKSFNMTLKKYWLPASSNEKIFQHRKLYHDKNFDCFVSGLNDDTMTKFVDKKIMIVCGGPSTNEVDWQNLEYDYLWTCNEFYKNEKLKNERVDFATLAPIVDLENEELKSKTRRDGTIISFPLIASYIHDNIPLDSVIKFAYEFPSQSCHWYTRYSSVIGTGVRMIAMAILCQAKEIYFVGVDGRSKVESDGNLLHVFDGDKPVPNWYNQYGDRFQVRQNLIFWDYVSQLKQKYDFNIYNLGEGQEYNSLTSVSKVLYPLNDEVKKKIGSN